MTNTIEYALMAGRAYQTTRDKINRFPIPRGWTPFFPVPDPATSTFPVTGGFEAVAFKKGTEIVIFFAGTDGFFSVDQVTNSELATGLTHNLLTGVPDQLLQAADYYLQDSRTGSSLALTHDTNHLPVQFVTVSSWAEM